jgi:hypothetical protein
MPKNNTQNPFGTHVFVWDAVKCDYCRAPAGSWCRIKNRTRVAQEIHSVRRVQQRQAYDAWELGREQGQKDVSKAVQGTLDLFQDVVAKLRAVQ